MRRQKAFYPAKRSMNLYYKPDRTTKPATVSLYMLFALVCLLGLSRPLVYDLCAETAAAQQTLAAAEEELSEILLDLGDYSQVQERYLRYSLTDEEKALVDRIEVLGLLDEAVGATADMESISISGDTVQLQFYDVPLTETSRIIRALEDSPLVAEITVNTALTRDETPPEVVAPVQVSILIHLQKEAAE